MISMTVRAFAEMLYLPGYEQVRILTEQKYPKREPQQFMIPFYQVALSGIRGYYGLGNDPQRIVAARSAASALRNMSRRRNNERVLLTFSRSPQSKRNLAPKKLRTVNAAVTAGVDLRLSFDLTADENSRPRHLFYNTRASQLDPDVARATLRIAHWVLGETGLAVPYRSIEYVDLAGGKTYVVTGQSQQLIRQMKTSARIVATLWPTI